MDRCAKCGKPMRPLQQTCQCGWVRGNDEEKQKREESIRRRDHFRCTFTNGTDRCPARGTMSEQVGGRERTWLCRDHFAARGDRKACLQILEKFLREGAPGPDTWREEMMRERMKK